MNKLGGQYPYAINGSHNHTDVYDYSYHAGYGWSAHYPHQKVTLPKFKEPQIERENFAIYLKFAITLINTVEAGNLVYGLIHRFKYNVNAVITKFSCYILKNNYGNSVTSYSLVAGSTNGLQNFGCNTVSLIKSSNMFSYKFILQHYSACWNK
jgi:hypothetical protein